MIALVIGAISLSWTADGPQFDAADSLRVMLVTQIVGATLLSPVICRSSVSTITAAVTLWPFIYAAAFLSTDRIGVNAGVGTYTTAWLLALGVGNLALKPPLLTTFIAFTAIWVLLDPMMAYLQLEFTTQKPLLFGPISGVFCLLDGSTDWRVALIPTALLGLAIVIHFLPFRR